MYIERTDNMKGLYAQPVTPVANSASAHVLQKNGFTLVTHAVVEDRGFPEPTPADKWLLRIVKPLPIQI